MNSTIPVVGNHSQEFLEPTWLRVSFPFSDQLPPANDVVIYQNIDFNSRRSTMAYNSARLGPFAQHSGPPPNYIDQPLLVQYHPVYRLFDIVGDYIDDKELELNCELTVEATTFEQQSLWQIKTRQADDGNLLLAYQAVMQFVRMPDGGWVYAPWIGNIAPSVRNMGWMLGGLALGNSVIGPDAVLNSGKLINSTLRGKSLIDTQAGKIIDSILDDATAKDMATIYSSAVTGAALVNARLRNVVCEGSIEIEGANISNLRLTGEGKITGTGLLDEKNFRQAGECVRIDGNIQVQPLEMVRPSRIPATSSAIRH